MEPKGSARWAAGDSSKDDQKNPATPKPDKTPAAIERPPKPVIRFQWLAEPRARPEKEFHHYELPNNETKLVPMHLERELRRAPEPDVAAQLKKAEEARFDKFQYHIVTDTAEVLEKEDAVDVNIVRCMQLGFSRAAAALALALHGPSPASEAAVLQFCEKFDKLKKDGKKPRDAFCKVVEEGLGKSPSKESKPLASFVVVDKEAAAKAAKAAEKAAKAAEKAKAEKAKLAGGQLHVVGYPHVHSHPSAPAYMQPTKTAIPDNPLRMPYPYAHVALPSQPYRMFTNTVDLRRYNTVSGADFKRYGL